MCTIPCNSNHPASQPVFTKRISQKRKYRPDCYDTLAFTMANNQKNQIKFSCRERNGIYFFIICVKPKFMVMVWSVRFGLVWLNHTLKTFQFPFECITKTWFSSFVNFNRLNISICVRANWLLDCGISEYFCSVKMFIRRMKALCCLWFRIEINSLNGISGMNTFTILWWISDEFRANDNKVLEEWSEWFRFD